MEGEGIPDSCPALPRNNGPRTRQEEGSRADHDQAGKQNANNPVYGCVVFDSTKLSVDQMLSSPSIDSCIDVIISEHKVASHPIAANAEI